MKKLLLAVTLSFGIVAYGDLSAYKWAVIGDSLSDPKLENNTDGPLKYYHYLQQTSGISVVYTNGVGGTGYKNGYDKAADKLADAGCFYQRLEAHPIPSDVDVVTFFGSINDGGFAETDEDLGTATDSLTDKTTLAAYMNKAIDLARAQAPNAKIILIGGIYFSASHATGHVRLNSMLGQIAAARKASGDSNIVNYDWLTEDPDDPLDFHQIIVNQSEEGCFGSLYTYDWKTRGKINESFGHPNPLYNEIWLAPHFGEVLSTELKATLGEVTTTPASNSCALASTVISLGVTSATACDVYLAYGTDEDNLGAAAKILSGLALDDSVAYTIENLEPGTEYFYELSAMNNAAIPEGGVKKGSFVTKRIATPVDGLGDFAKKVVFTFAAGGQPTLVKISEAISGFRYSDCAANGSDIRFADAEDEAVPYEIVTWNPAGESLVWVKAPAGDGEVAVTMYYSGVPAAANVPSAVWSAYTGVWHFDTLGADDTAASQGTYANSTATEGIDGHLSTYSVPDEAGVVGKSFKVNASKAGYHQAGYEKGGMWVVDSGEGSPLDADGVFTISGWFKHDGTYVYNNVLAKRNDNGNTEDPKGAFFVRMHEQGSVPKIQAYGSTSGSVELSAASEQKANMIDNWVYLTFVYNDKSLSIYQNGELCKSGTIVAATNNDAPLVFGNNTVVADGGDGNGWHGWIDEARYTKGVAMTAAEVAAEYAAMANASFVTADAAENVDGTITPKPPKLGEVSVTVTSTNAVISGTITSVGNNGATACDVYLSLDGAAAEKIVEGATVEFEYEIEGLVPETTYAYTLTISNDAATVMGASKSGSFTTEAAPEDPEPIDPPHGPTGSGKKVTYTVNYEGPVGVTDIPVLVRLAANLPEGFAYADCASDGSDIRFQDANGVALPFEIDTWDPTGESLIWVKAPSVEKDTTFTMTFGDTPAAANTPSATWSGYTGVWHFNELGVDATANSKGVFANSTSVTGIDAHLSVASTAGEAGKFGSSFRPNDATGKSADGFNDGGAWVVDSGSDSPLDANGNLTVSGWFKHQSWDFNYDKLIFKRENDTVKDEGGFTVDANSNGGNNGRVQVRSSDGSQRVRDESCTGPDLRSDWVYVTAVYSSSNNRVWLFENGVQINYAQYRGKAEDNDMPLVFGNNTAIVGSATGTGANAWNGWIDEARYIRDAKSAEWIAAEYAAMADANFLSAGKVEGSGEEPEPPEEPEEVPVYTLTIPAKTGLVVESVKTNDVAITGEAGAYRVCSNATVTITFAADEDYEITGGNPVVVTVESDRTLADGEYPTVQPVEPPQPPPGDEILPGATPAETRATIQSVIDAAAPTHGTVTLAAGLFEIDVELFVTNGVTLVGQGWTNTVVKQTTAMKGNETHRVITIKGGSTLEGVAVTGGNADQNNAVGGGILITDSGNVSWCCVTNNCTTRSNGGGVYVSDDGGQVRIDHTIVSDNTCGTAYLDGNGGGIAILGKTGCQVEIDACLVCRNTAGASGRTSNGGGIALLDKNTDNASVIVRNTTIADNAAVGNGVGGGVYAGKMSVTLVNCLVAGNTSETAAAYGNADVAYKAENLAPAVTTCVIAPVSAGFVGDGDYHLAEGSSAIGVGTAYDGIGNDLDDKPFAATPSIGCYEFGSAPTVPKYEISWSGAANATVVAEVNGNAIDSGAKIGSGTNVVFTVTPNTDYEFAAASYEGWTLTEGILTRTITVGGEEVTIVIPDATAKSVPPGPSGSGKKVTYTVNYEGPAGIADIPVLVRLAANSPEGFDYADCASDGSDIRFQDANGVALPFEIDTWDTSGESLIWVKAPSVEKDTTFTMVFGSTPAAANTPSATWSGYTGVWHFNELGVDATANSKGVFANSTSVTGIDAHLSVASTAGEAGKFGSSFRPNDATGKSADGFNDGGAWVVDSGSDSPLDANGNLTVSGWFKHQSWDFNYDKLIFKRENDTVKDEGGFTVDANSNGGNNGRVQVRSSDGSLRVRDESYTGPDLRSDWVYVTAVYSSSNNRVWLFENGVQINYAQYRGKAEDNDMPLVFGNNTAIVGSATGTGANAWNGWIDEARYIRETKSADWIAAEYAAMADADFLSASAVEDVGPTVPKYAVSWSGAANATVVAEADGNAISSGMKVGDGTNVVFTVTPKTNYEFAAASYDGWTLTEGVLTRTITVNGEAVSILIPDATAKVVPPQPTGSGKKVTYTVNYEGPVGVTDIPVLVRLAANSPEGFAYADCASDGSDIRFQDANGVALPFEIDTWDTTGESLIWVKAPSVEKDTTFTMTFGSTPAAANTPSATWSGYSGVWHLNDLGTDATQYSQGVYPNSTAATGIDAHLSSVSIPNEDGKFGKSFRPNDSTGYMQGNYQIGGAWVVDPGADSPIDSDGGKLTVSGWIRHQDWFNAGDERIFYKRLDSDNADSPNGAFVVEAQGAPDFKIAMKGSGSNRNRDDGPAAPSPRTDWIYVTAVFDGQTHTLYVNGGEFSKTGIYLSKVNDNDAPLVFGNTVTIADGENGSNAWNGWIDEVRYLKSVKSADWIAAEYAAMADANFLSAGEVEDVGPTVPKYEVSWSGAANATVVAKADGNAISSGMKVGDGTNVVFTVTPDTDYEFAAASYAGWTLTEGVLTRTITVNGEAVSIVIPDATAKVVPPQPQPEPGEPVDAIAVSDVYPESVPAGYVVTFYAPNKTNPFYVVPASSYTDAHQSSSMNKTFYFRDEDDFEANASAMIGSSCYLFLADAVAVCTGGETIEMLRDDNMVAKTMSIGYPLTIHGNGYTVKVKVPFVDESGFVNTNCTTEVKTIFHIANGGDVFIDDMTIMGGGERLASNNDGKSDATTPAVVVAGDVNGGPNQTGTTGILRMEHVTITRSQGGLFTGIGAKVLLEACNLVRNARYCGGGLYNRGFLVMVDSSLSENRSLNNLGGGAAAENQGMMFMNNCVVCNNGSTEFGGAINVYNNSKIDTDQGKITRLYLMNTTISGNFSSHVNDCGGGIGTHTTIANGVQVYAVNSLICNNSHYVVDADGDRVTASDFHAVAAPNAFAYSVYGTISSSSQKPQLVGCPAAVDASAADVFKDYAATPRVYQHDLMTVPITGATLESDSDEPLARYAPIQVGGKADIGNSGVYTYFDASGWRDGVVKMSYQPFGAETMSEIGELEVATAGDLVTNYYESAFVPNIRARELGVVGASGFGTDVKNYTLTLIEAPVNGSVGNITIFGDSYREGTEVTVTATPDFGCAFVGWYDADGVMVSESSSYRVLMDSDKSLKAVFKTSSVINLEVACEQTLGAHTDFPIGVTRAWLAKNGLIASEDAEIDVTSVQDALNATDADNGLRHVWQNYVLGLNKGDPSGRIWINAEQNRDADNIRFKTQPLAPVQGSGFSIRYRFDAKPADGEWTRTASVNKDATLASGQFDVATDANANGNYVIDLIFVPDGSVSSEEYVTTVNTAGVIKVESSKKVEILGAPWAGFSPTENPAVKATDYAKASCLSEGDVLYVYDQANSNYLAWAVQPDGTWAAVKTYTLANGVAKPSAADATRTNDIPRGAGVWLERKDTTKPIFLYGQVGASSVMTSLAPGYNLVANPYPTAFAASTLPEPANKGDTGDRIAIPTSGAPINAYYRDGAWKTPHNREVTITNPVTKEEMTGFKTEWTSEGLTLPAGLGFWYFNAGSGYVELTWPAGE